MDVDPFKGENEFSSFFVANNYGDCASHFKGAETCTV